MIDEALTLFTAHGYDETTMEQVAEAAEVAPSTLYRYFPSKDLLLLDRLSEGLDLADQVGRQPAQQSLATALGAALLAVARSFDDPARQITEVRRIVDGAPVPRAKVFDLYLRARADLEVVIAERLDVPTGALLARASAGRAMDVIQMCDEIRREADYSVSATETVRTILVELPGLAVTTPCLA